MMSPHHSRRRSSFGAVTQDARTTIAKNLALLQRLGTTGQATLADLQALDPNATQTSVDAFNGMSPQDRQAQIAAVQGMAQAFLAAGPGFSAQPTVNAGDDPAVIDQFRGYAFRYTLQPGGAYLVERIPGQVGPPAFTHPIPASATISLEELTALMMGGFGPTGPIGTSMGTAKPTAAALARAASGKGPLFTDTDRVGPDGRTARERARSAGDKKASFGRWVGVLVGGGVAAAFWPGWVPLVIGSTVGSYVGGKLIKAI